MSNSLFSSLIILSGGQTGVDRAALDFAIARGIDHGGWCPRGRAAEDGPIASHYQLEETPSATYSQRTEWNVRDADATLVISPTRATSGGTLLTIEWARQLDKPLLHLTGEESPDASAASLCGFLDVYRVQRLNIAGPRESQAPGVGELVHTVLSRALGEPAAILV